MKAQQQQIVGFIAFILPHMRHNKIRLKQFGLKLDVLFVKKAGNVHD